MRWGLGDQTNHEDNIYFFDKQNISLERLPTDRYILDLGGGGEGIIGRLMGKIGDSH